MPAVTIDAAAVAGYFDGEVMATSEASNGSHNENIDFLIHRGDGIKLIKRESITMGMVQSQNETL